MNSNQCMRKCTIASEKHAYICNCKIKEQLAFTVRYHISPKKCAEGITISNFCISFENSVDPNHLASNEEAFF